MVENEDVKDRAEISAIGEERKRNLCTNEFWLRKSPRGNLRLCYVVLVMGEGGEERENEGEREREGGLTHATQAQGGENPHVGELKIHN